MYILSDAMFYSRMSHLRLMNVIFPWVVAHQHDLSSFICRCSHRQLPLAVPDHREWAGKWTAMQEAASHSKRLYLYNIPKIQYMATCFAQIYGHDSQLSDSWQARRRIEKHSLVLSMAVPISDRSTLYNSILKKDIKVNRNMDHQKAGEMEAVWLPFFATKFNLISITAECGREKSSM